MEKAIILGAFEAGEGATLTVGRVDAGLRRCGQVVATVQVVQAGSFVESTFRNLIFGMIPFVVHWCSCSEGIG